MRVGEGGCLFLILLCKKVRSICKAAAIYTKKVWNEVHYYAYFHPLHHPQNSSNYFRFYWEISKKSLNFKYIQTSLSLSPGEGEGVMLWDKINCRSLG